MSQAAALNQFLAEIEKRAYAMTLLSVKNPEDALDIVQDAMFKLARRYGNRSPEEWPPLFYRVLKNRTTDFHRGQAIRNKLFGWLPVGDADVDPVAEVPGAAALKPDRQARFSDFGEHLLTALEQLPRRQREAFVLRTWEGLDVKQTAQAMGVSQGSVKTHYSRAVAALREHLVDYRDD